MTRDRSGERISKWVDLLTLDKADQCNIMSSQADKVEAELKQLWAGKVSPLTPEQIELALQLWQKIKIRRAQEKG